MASLRLFSRRSASARASFRHLANSGRHHGRAGAFSSADRRPRCCRSDISEFQMCIGAKSTASPGRGSSRSIEAANRLAKLCCRSFHAKLSWPRAVAYGFQVRDVYH